MDVIASNRVDLTPLVTHRVKLDDIEKAYDLFSHQRDGVLEGSTVCALIRRLNSSCSHSIGFDVRIDFHRFIGKRVKGGD